jgi:copper transport protein
MSWILCSQRQRGLWPLAPLALTLLGMWLLITSPRVARAHALLVRSLPEANTNLAQPPASIDMWFSEPLEADFSGARLLNSLGEEVPTGAVSLDPSDPTHLTLALGQLQPGIYTVAWQTLSQVDGHEWFGSFPFTVLNPDGSRPTGAAAMVGGGRRGDLPTPGEIASRWLALLGGILFLGAPLFQLVVAPASKKPRQRNASLPEMLSRDLVLRAMWIAVLAIVLGSWLQIVLQALRLGGLAQLPDLLFGTRTGTLVLVRQVLALTGLFVALGLPQPRPLTGREWPAFILTGVCGAVATLLLLVKNVQEDRILVLTTIALAGLGMALATLAPRQDRRVTEHRTWQAVLILASVLLLSVSLGSHAGAVPGSVWAVLGDYIHLVAAATWAGGLALLPVLIWQIRREATPADRRQFLLLVRRFSYLAGFSVFALVVTGLFNGMVELPSLSSLWETSYGWVLLIKLFLIALTLEVAFFNNRFVHYRDRQLHQASGLRLFNRQVALEAFVGLGIVLSVAILVQTPTPRSLTQPTQAFQPDLPFNTVTRVDDLYVHVQVIPNQVGNNRFWVHLYHGDNSPIGETQLVRLFFNYREQQIGQARADLEPLGRNTFAVEGAYVNQAGLWDLSVYVRRRGLDDVLAEVSLDIPAPTNEGTGTNPWQNPISTLPAGLVIAGVLAALGAIPFIWHRPLRKAQARLSLAASLSGGMLILAGLVTTVSSAPALFNPAGQPVPASPDSIATGAELFQENCAVCHGVEGLGDGPRAASLDPPPASLRIHVPLHNDRELYGFISEGFLNTAMPAFKDGLTNEEIWHLVNYLRDEFE